jgi:hypothetical protein
MVCLMTAVMLTTGCVTRIDQNRVRDLTPASASCDESFHSSKDLLGFEREATKMDVTTTNAGGYFHQDNSTSYSSGFRPFHGLFAGIGKCFQGLLVVPTGLVIEDGNNACVRYVPGAVYDVGGGCNSGEWVSRVRLTQPYIVPRGRAIYGQESGGWRR